MSEFQPIAFMPGRYAVLTERDMSGAHARQQVRHQGFRGAYTVRDGDAEVSLTADDSVCAAIRELTWYRAIRSRARSRPRYPGAVVGKVIACIVGSGLLACGRGSHGGGGGGDRRWEARAADAMGVVEVAMTCEGLLRAALSGTDGMNADAAAASAAARVTEAVFMPECVKTTVSGRVVAYQFDDCIAQNWGGRFIGPLEVTWSGQAGGLTASLTTGDRFQYGGSGDQNVGVRGRRDLSVRAEVAANGSFAGAIHATTALTRFDGTLTLTLAPDISVRQVRGSATLFGAGGATYPMEIDYAQSAMSSCPAGGEVVLHVGGDSVTVTTRGPGGAQEQLPWKASTGESGTLDFNKLPSTYYRCEWRGWPDH